MLSWGGSWTLTHQRQIARIIEKLAQARWSDSEYKVFGSAQHRYQVGPTASEAEVQEFESLYEVKLPSCYRAFLLEVGNGGVDPRSAAAGPFYGVYGLGECIDDIVDNPILDALCTLEPDPSGDAWTESMARLNSPELPDSDYLRELSELYAGVLPIGSQGCSFVHAILLTGPYRGRVVNVNLDREKPKFTFEENFLDWYERWIDEVNTGLLSVSGPTWFGYVMGGTCDELVAAYEVATDVDARLEVLRGLGRLRECSASCSQWLHDLSHHPNQSIRYSALRLLTKFAYETARDRLQANLAGDDSDCLVVAESIHWYAREEASSWGEEFLKRLPSVSHPATFRFFTYVLGAAEFDFHRELQPFTVHPSREIRVSAFFALGKHPGKGGWAKVLGVGLDDEDPRVVHTALQALEGTSEPALLEAYSRVLDRFDGKDEHSILTNLEARVREHGYTSLSAFQKDGTSSWRYPRWMRSLL